MNWDNRNTSKFPSPLPGKTGWPWTTTSELLPDKMPDGSPWPKISVVTPSYNQGKFIEETIRSVLLQGYPNLEFIIIDGGSTDNTLEIINKYEPWLDYWVSEPDRGQSHAINKGWDKCNGEIISWLNSDDLYLPNSLRIIAETYKNSKEAIIFIGGCSICNENLEEIFYKLPKYLDSKDLITGGGVVGQPSVFFIRDILYEIGGLDETLSYVMDWEFWIRIGMYYGNKEQKLINEVLSIARVWDGSQSAIGVARFDTTSEQKNANERFKVLDNLFTDQNIALRYQNIKNLAYSRNLKLKAHYQKASGDLKSYRKSLLEAYIKSPSSYKLKDISLEYLFSFQLMKSLARILRYFYVKTGLKKTLTIIKEKHNTEILPIGKLRCQEKPFSELLGFSGKPIEFFPPYSFFELSLTRPKDAYNKFYEWLYTSLIDMQGWKISQNEGGMAESSLVKLIMRLQNETEQQITSFREADPSLIRDGISQKTKYYFDMFSFIKKFGYKKIKGKPIYCYPKNDDGFYVIYDGHHRISAMKILGSKEVEVVILR